MNANFYTQQEIEEIGKVFGYMHDVCGNFYGCVNCPFAGYTPLETNVGIFHCETGMYKGREVKPDDESAGTNADEENQGGNDQS